MPAMDVNDNACILNAGVVLAFFASKLAPTMQNLVGVGLPAMVVNDNAGIQDERVFLAFFASKLAPTKSNTVQLEKVAQCNGKNADC